MNKAGKSTMRSRSSAPKILCLAFIFLCCFGFCSLPSLADVGSSDLNTLEQKFFDHTYPQDSTSNRLERLEKMVFGEAKSGSDGERLASLLASIPSPTPDQTAAASPAPQSAAPTQSSSANQNTAATQDPITDSSDYPRVTTLEQRLLGKTYTSDSVQNRLGRLEQKAFGKQSKSDDLGTRTDALDQYVANRYGRQQPAGDEDDNFPAQQTAQSRPNYPLYQQYNQAASGAGYNAPNYSQQQFAQAPQYNQYQQAQPPQYGYQNQNQNQKTQKNHSLLKGLGHVLGAVGSMAATAASSGMMGMGSMGGYGYGGMGGYGMGGYGMGNYGMGGYGMGGYGGMMNRGMYW